MIDMILNPGEPNQEETQKLVEALATTLKDPGAREYALTLIERVIVGYEHQSGKEYEGYRPGLD